MSLYLTIFDGEEELEGWCVGHYSDFGYFRDTIAEKLGAERYPTLMAHEDCDGEWSVQELEPLRAELLGISEAARKLHAEEPIDAFEHTAEFRAGARSLLEVFHNVDGENLIEALIALCDAALRFNRSILFQ
jgi:hypothetical protein